MDEYKINKKAFIERKTSHEVAQDKADTDDQDLSQVINQLKENNLGKAAETNRFFKAETIQFRTFFPGDKFVDWSKEFEMASKNSSEEEKFLI